MAKFTRDEAIAKLQSYRELAKLPFTPQTAIIIVDNMTILVAEEKVMKIASEQIEKIMKEYTVERITLCESVALKDAEGRAMNDGIKYLFPTPQIEAETEAKVLELDTKYADSLAQRDLFKAQIPVLLQEEVEYDLRPINLKDTTGSIRPEVLVSIRDNVAK